MNLNASLLAMIVSFVATTLIGAAVLPILKKLNIDQTTKRIGPTWHKSKDGTPTMGGIFLMAGIFLGVVAACLLLKSNENIFDFELLDSVRLWSGLFCALGFGLVGFMDDYIKVVRKNNNGLSPMQKTAFLLTITLAYFLTMSLNGCLSTIVDIPFFGQVNFGIFYYIISILGIYGMANAVNLTDGIDGLASSVTAVYAIAFMIISNILLCQSMNIFASALCGGCLGFLIYNFHPAKVFMGDTGSMFLGGATVALGFGVGQPALVILVGIIYMIEPISVIMQVISFKLTKKRIFKMSPIHHHFELSGWSEVKIVIVFSLITAVGSCIAIASLLK